MDRIEKKKSIDLHMNNSMTKYSIDDLKGVLVSNVQTQYNLLYIIEVYNCLDDQFYLWVNIIGITL